MAHGLKKTRNKFLRKVATKPRRLKEEIKMKKITKNRIVMATGGLLLTAVSAFIAGGLTVCIKQIYSFGLQTPDKFGWFGLFVLWGVLIFVAIGPALLLMTIISIIKCSPLKLRIIFNIINAFIVSSISVIVIVICGCGGSSIYFAGLTSFIIIIISELLFRNKFQKTNLKGKNNEN